MDRTEAADVFLGELESVRSSLYLFARRSLLRPEQSDDVIQESVLVAWRDFGKFKAGTNFRAWIFKILVNSIWSANKRGARIHRHEISHSSLDLVEAIRLEEAWQTLIGDREQLFACLDEHLSSALRSLAPTIRECLLLRYLGDFSYRDIAGIVRLPVGTVMSHVHRARMSLRERLASLATQGNRVEENPS